MSDRNPDNGEPWRASGTILPILPHPDYVHAWPDRSIPRIVKVVLVVAVVVVVLAVMR